MESALKIYLLSLHKILRYLACKLTSVPAFLKDQVKDNKASCEGKGRGLDPSLAYVCTNFSCQPLLPLFL